MYLNLLGASGESFILVFSHREFDCIQTTHLEDLATFGKVAIREGSVMSSPTLHGSLNVA
jgi:hypothetical protein